MQGAGFDPWSRNQCPTCHRATKPLQHNEDPAKPKEKEKKNERQARYDDGKGSPHELWVWSPLEAGAATRHVNSRVYLGRDSVWREDLGIRGACHV